MTTVAFIDTLGLCYDGSTLHKRGLGGSESAVISISRELVKLGFDVTVFNDCYSDDCKPGIYDGVEYAPLAYINNYEKFDVFIASRSVVSFMPDSRKHEFKWASKLPNIERVAMASTYRVLWMHDTFCDGDLYIEKLVTTGRIHSIFTLSDWHTAYVTNCNHGKRRNFETLKPHIFQTRNGINLYHEEVDVTKKDRNLFVYNASVTKGMVPLVEKIWPKFKKMHPDAKLIVVGGYYKFREDQGPDAQELKHQELVEKCKNLDITFTGVITQKEIASILVRASFMMYPSAFPETFGISSLESLAYNTPIITCNHGALEETAVDLACYKIKYAIEPNVLFTEIDTDSQCDLFVHQASLAYQTGYLHQQKMHACNQVKAVCTWDTVALQWKQHFYKQLDQYLSIDDYRQVKEINERVRKVFNRSFINAEERVENYNDPCQWPFSIIVPVYNAEDYIEKCLHSILAQDYDVYDVYVIDDASTDNTFQIILDFKAKYDNENRINVIENTRNMGAVYNQVNTINRYCDEEDVILLIDGDDWLANDPTIFKRINNLYHKEAEFTYGSCWSLADNIPLIAQPYPESIKQSKDYRNYKFNWGLPYTHLRTFRASLIRDADLSNFKNERGEWYRAGGDNAVFYTAIEAADPKNVICVPDILYVYNDKNPLNDYKVNGEEQNQAAKKIVDVGKKEEKMKKILIAIPTAKYIESETFKSIYDLEIPDGYEIEFQYFYGYQIDQIRNLIANWAKHYDYLFSVDSDIILPKNTLTKMIAADKDIISGLYIQRHVDRQVVELYQVANGGIINIPYSLLEKPQVVEVAGCGFGCVLIKNKVFTTMQYPHFVYQSALTMEGTVSEDVYFCKKARELGFTVWADTSIICDHVGSYKFSPYTYTERNIEKVFQQDILPKDHVAYLEKLDVKPKVIYDIGACVKHWARHAERLWDSKVYLFDANSNLRKLYDKVGNEYYLGVLSDDNKVVKFYEDGFNLGGNSYYKENTTHYNESHSKNVRADTLNNVVAERNWTLPDMIKLDVQGAEVDILKGASQILTNCKDIIIEAQVIDYNVGAPKEAEVIEFMNSIGYALKSKITNNTTDNDYHFVKTSES